MVDDDQNVCSFCGMSHLMYSEMKKKERRIAELEKELEQARTGGARPVSAEASAAHYAQLKMVTDSCAEKLKGMKELERRLEAQTAQVGWQGAEECGQNRRCKNKDG